ncbi:MAG: hypothetical protein AB7D57_14890 [Desulfovibrionaceae bacterium]
MHLSMKFDTEGVDWAAAAAVYAAASLAPRDPARLAEDFAAARAVCFTYDLERLTGLARVVEGDSGPVIRDLAVLPAYVGMTLGHIMRDYLGRRVGAELKVASADPAERHHHTQLELDEFLLP